MMCGEVNRAGTLACTEYGDHETHSATDAGDVVHHWQNQDAYSHGLQQANTARQILDRGARPAKEKLADLADARDAIEAAIQTLVRVARDHDETWTEIGLLLGCSKQAAQQRYGKKPTGPASPEDDPLPI